MEPLSTSVLWKLQIQSKMRLWWRRWECWWGGWCSVWAICILLQIMHALAWFCNPKQTNFGLSQRIRAANKSNRSLTFISTTHPPPLPPAVLTHEYLQQDKSKIIKFHIQGSILFNAWYWTLTPEHADKTNSGPCKRLVTHVGKCCRQLNGNSWRVLLLRLWLEWEGW